MFYHSITLKSYPQFIHNFQGCNFPNVHLDITLDKVMQFYAFWKTEILGVDKYFLLFFFHYQKKPSITGLYFSFQLYFLFFCGLNPSISFCFSEFLSGFCSQTFFVFEDMKIEKDYLHLHINNIWNKDQTTYILVYNVYFGFYKVNVHLIIGYNINICLQSKTVYALIHSQEDKNVRNKKYNHVYIQSISICVSFYFHHQENVYILGFVNINFDMDTLMAIWIFGGLTCI